MIVHIVLPTLYSMRIGRFPKMGAPKSIKIIQHYIDDLSVESHGFGDPPFTETPIWQ